MFVGKAGAHPSGTCYGQNVKILALEYETDDDEILILIFRKKGATTLSITTLSITDTQHN
jgi:hypothetical protein